MGWAGGGGGGGGVRGPTIADYALLRDELTDAIDLDGWEPRCCFTPTFEFCLRVSGDGTPLRRYPLRAAARKWRTRCPRPTQVAFVRCAKPVSVLCGRWSRRMLAAVGAGARSLGVG